MIPNLKNKENGMKFAEMKTKMIPEGIKEKNTVKHRKC